MVQEAIRIHLTFVTNTIQTHRNFQYLQLITSQTT